MEAFRYDSLDLSRPTLRLVRLLKGAADDPRCEIFHASFDKRQDAISYEALSYTWGSENKTDSIWINGKSMRVTNNLAQVLRYLTFEDRDRILWVDALCINQKDNNEKSHQVRQMGHIYQEAESVIFWLGPATYETNVVVDSLHELQVMSKNFVCTDRSQNDPVWNTLWEKVIQLQKRKHDNLDRVLSRGLRELTTRPWFDRVWILQEVANAQSAFVHCGTRAVSARFFAMAPNFLEIELTSQCRAVLAIMPGQSRKESWWSSNRTLHSLLSHFSRSQSQCPQDLVYALLNISSDAQQSSGLLPNYDKVEREVLEETFRFLFSIEMSNDLRIHLNTIEDLAINMKYVTDVVVTTFIKSSNAARLGKFLARYDLTATPANLLTAAGQAPDIWSVLFERTRDVISLDDDLFLAMLNSRRSAPAFTALDDRLFPAMLNTRRRAPAFTHLDDGLFQAMRKRQGSLIALLEMYFCKTRWKIRLSQGVLAQLLRVRPVWLKFISVLLGKPGLKDNIAELLATAVSRGSLKNVREILRVFGNRVSVNDNVLMAAFESRSPREDILSLLLRERSGEIMITESLLNAAFENRDYGERVLTLLLQGPQVRLSVTESAFDGAILMWGFDSSISGLLFEKRRGRFEPKPESEPESTEIVRGSNFSTAHTAQSRDL